ncbi:hypothetical protein S7335_3501 [Synechococcus sp. PCC 7335]|uniref:hypothetical protein n=1 Tax=Synechococcus sp. (strain ATCC 29403 / PCC 7335) TaxID=91464 RepID=UPI00017EB485|nr:hypothetical protein [Synechococcus sp. PCC 7335]EDX85798.1 hypothetical protein S7335_3501 [Synechococcus sp. PCC 7335]
MISAQNNAPFATRANGQLPISDSSHLSWRKWLRLNNPFNYRICISWFGGVQIHPKF